MRRRIHPPQTPAPKFSGPVDKVVLNTTAQAAKQSAFLPNLIKFLTSRETFYRFWTEIAGAALTGTFLLIANRRKNAPQQTDVQLYRPPSRLSRRG